jgi:hypothetical protein
MEVSLGKSSVNGPFSIAMLNYQRVKPPTSKVSTSLQELQDSELFVDVVTVNASITAMARSNQWQRALTLHVNVESDGIVN